ncbi:hypothetical protein [Vibrio sp. Hal054]|uniref:hypothetical protein n=1 Tax=Vibrio sp. Hal054 TaxID=3035158 RepID=UPI00301C9B0D
MNEIRIKSKENGVSLSLSFPSSIEDNAPQTGLFIFAGGVASGKLTLAQTTMKQFNTEAALYEELRNRDMALECLEKSKLKLCFATIHAESKSDVLETLKELGLLESMHQIKAIHYCNRVGQTLESQQLELE